MTLLVPMRIMTSFGRVVSPITTTIVAIAGVAGVSSVQDVKKALIPDSSWTCKRGIYIYKLIKEMLHFEVCKMYSQKMLY